MTKYLITQFDFNDVFDKTELDFDNYDKAVQYVKEQFREDIRDQIDCIGGDPESYVIWMPVTDDQGNEISQEDPRWEEFNDQQEARVQLGYTIEELEN